MRTILKSIKKSLKEISPFENIRVLGSNPKGDILAGITVAIIALPLALAFGEISKLGPIAGIWGAIAGGIFGGFLEVVWWGSVALLHQKQLKLLLL